MAKMVNLAQINRYAHTVFHSQFLSRSSLYRMGTFQHLIRSFAKTLVNFRLPVAKKATFQEVPLPSYLTCSQGLSDPYILI